MRNIKCIRCGEWGHTTGDRECPLRDFNPHDAARQQKEDPMAYMQKTLQVQKQKLILKQALVSGCGAHELVQSDDEEGDSDPEAEFLGQSTKLSSFFAFTSLGCSNPSPSSQLRSHQRRSGNCSNVCSGSNRTVVGMATSAANRSAVYS